MRLFLYVLSVQLEKQLFCSFDELNYFFLCKKVAAIASLCLLLMPSVCLSMPCLLNERNENELKDFDF